MRKQLVNYRSILTLVLAICLSTITVFAQAAKKKAATLTITSKDNGKTVTVKKNQTFNVLFAQECRGCQGIWNLTKSDTAIVKSVKDFFSNPSCTNCAGGNQDHTFQFKAVKAGKSTLAFEYMGQAFQVTILVK